MSAPRADRTRDPAALLVAVGCAHALLFVAAYFLLSSTPRVTASDEELVAFYASDRRRVVVVAGLYVMPFAGIAFLWFGAALRGWLRVVEDRVAALVWGLHLASSLLYVALFFTGAAAASAPALTSGLSDRPLDPALARELQQLGATILVVFGMRMAAMFVFTTSRLARLAGVLPRWYALVGLVVGTFLLLSTTFSRALVLVFPLWLIGLCVFLWRNRAVGAPLAGGG